MSSTPSYLFGAVHYNVKTPLRTLKKRQLSGAISRFADEVVIAVFYADWTGTFTCSRIPDGSTYVFYRVDRWSRGIPGRSAYTVEQASLLLGGPFPTLNEIPMGDSIEIVSIRLKPWAATIMTMLKAQDAVATIHADPRAILFGGVESFYDDMASRDNAEERALLLEQWLSRNLRHHAMSKYHLLCEQAMAYLQAPDPTWRVDDLAGALNISSKTLDRAFMEGIGLNPKEYLRYARLNRCAATSLMDLSIPLVGLASESGYSDQACMTREFTEMLGISPAKMRRLIRAGGIIAEGVIAVPRTSVLARIA